ncbi:hypothetical protein HPP92_021677 [Vanilla planifolia]|uniref:Uncharacterized protein n=1 Tax=Vanilla planifolia TaxID=51239 RepID=A0A835Q310_VANPL|nr:hypothetical protein HPP92_021677 [Vanilla planifolia]
MKDIEVRALSDYITIEDILVGVFGGQNVGQNKKTNNTKCENEIKTSIKPVVGVEDAGGVNTNNTMYPLELEILPIQQGAIDHVGCHNANPKIPNYIMQPWKIGKNAQGCFICFGGLNVGSILGLLFAPPIIQTFGWESLFYIFGVLGIIWCLLFEFVKEAQSSHDGNYLDLMLNSMDSGGQLLDSSPQKKSWNSLFSELSNSLKSLYNAVKTWFKLDGSCMEVEDEEMEA